MIKSIWLTVALVCAFAPEVLADAKKDAIAHSEAFAKACEAGDVPAVLALYADDATVIWPGQGEEGKGKKNIEILATNLCKNLKNHKLKLKALEATPIGQDYIATIGRWEQSFTGPDGKDTVARVRTTELLKKTDGKWLYLIDHASIGLPRPPEGGPAVLPRSPGPGT